MQALDSKQTVAVIGAGTMGAGIAQVAAQAGHPVSLYDVADGAAEKALEDIARQLTGRVDKGKLSAAEREAVLTRLTPAASLEALAPAALVIEAVVEKLDVKQELFLQLEALCGQETILASNTSSLSITAIGAALDHPGRLVGMHFFNPAPVMKLVEVVSGLASDPEILTRIEATAVAWGKQPVMARSTPGFIVNRVARPYYAETLRLLQEQAADPATLDALLREAGGFPMGPCQLTDLIGQDVNAAVTRSVFEAYHGDPRYKPSLIQEELVAAGRLGRKSGRGFYDYGADLPEPAQAPAAPAPKSVRVCGELGVAEPLVERLRQAGVECVREKGQGLLELGGVRIALSDGRSATERAADDDHAELVLFDLVLDYAAAGRIALAAADQAGPAARLAAAGLFQAAGLQVSWLDDAPALAVLRTVAMLANEGAEAVHHGVCEATAVDRAMRYGTNYPRGPLAWADELGASFLLRVLEHLQAAYGEDRYRPSPRLRRIAAARSHFHAGADQTENRP